MANPQASAKMPRKPPEPRGLTVALPVDVTEELRGLAIIAGISTKEALAANLTAFLEDGGLDPYRRALIKNAEQRLEEAKARAGKAAS